MLIAAYSRDENGSMTYHGEEEWDTENDYWVYYFRDDHAPEIEQGLMGWPHSSVEWRGNTGIGRH